VWSFFSFSCCGAIVAERPRKTIYSRCILRPFYEEHRLICVVEQTAIYFNFCHALFFAFSCNFQRSIYCKTDYSWSLKSYSYWQLMNRKRTLDCSFFSAKSWTQYLTNVGAITFYRRKTALLLLVSSAEILTRSFISKRSHLLPEQQVAFLPPLNMYSKCIKAK